MVDLLIDRLNVGINITRQGLLVSLVWFFSALFTWISFFVRLSVSLFIWKAARVEYFFNFYGWPDISRSELLQEHQQIEEAVTTGSFLRCPIHKRTKSKRLRKSYFLLLSYTFEKVFSHMVNTIRVTLEQHTLFNMKLLLSFFI